MSRLSKLSIYLVMIAVLSSCGAAKLGRDAMIAKNLGEHYKAIQKFRKATRKEKSRTKRREYAYAIAEEYRLIGDYERAAIYYKNAIRRGYSNPMALLYYADMLRATQDYEKSIENYRLFLDTIPGDERALRGLNAIRKTQELVANPTRHIINPIKKLNSFGSDYAPVFVGGKENEIIFTSTRKASTGKKKSNITGDNFSDLYRATFGIQKQKWEEPQLLDEDFIINTEEEEGAVTLSNTGDQMIFTRARYDKEKNMGTELYTTAQSRSSWSDPIRIDVVSDSLIAAHPALSDDEQTLYFVSDMPGGKGGKDIWRAKKVGGTFKNPVNLGDSINTPGDEIFPYVRDNGELYFSSNYHLGMGGFDIFKAEKKGDAWHVENMGAPMNSPSDDFGIAFVHGENKGMFSSNRKGSRSDDIYSFMVPPKIYTVEGDVFNKETGEKVSTATVKIIGTDGTNLKIRTKNGNFKFKLKPETEYVFAVFKDGYLRDKAAANTIGLEDSKDFRFDLFLTPTDSPIKVENINYEFGKWDLLEASKASLDTLVNILLLNPTITIELMAHTDHVGSNQANSELSQKRAQSVVNYLIEKGINAQRLVAKGYGETWPKEATKSLAKQYDFLKKGDMLTESFILQLTPQQQEIATAINRRTEFRVLSTDFIEKFAPEMEE